MVFLSSPLFGNLLLKSSIKALTTAALSLMNAVYPTLVLLWGQNIARVVPIALLNTNVAIRIALPLGRCAAQRAIGALAVMNALLTRPLVSTIVVRLHIVLPM